MKIVHIHPDDRARMMRWLRGHVFGVFVFACLMSVLADNPRRPILTRAPATSASMPIASSGLDPDGWRRTKKGWEHISTWPPAPRPLGEWIQSQQNREPAWVQRTLAELRETPPLIFAMIQITAIVAIVVMTEKPIASKHQHVRQQHDGDDGSV